MFSVLSFHSMGCQTIFGRPIFLSQMYITPSGSDDPPTGFWLSGWSQTIWALALASQYMECSPSDSASGLSVLHVEASVANHASAPNSTRVSGLDEC
jgi:hypothetical protein